MGFDQDAKEIELIQNVEDLVVKGKSNRKYLQRLVFPSSLSCLPKNWESQKTCSKGDCQDKLPKENTKHCHLLALCP